MDDRRAELVVVAGGTTPVAAADAERVIARIRAAQPGTAVLHHDLREVGRGLVRRRVRLGDEDEVGTLDLVHGCVSCTLREDVLPLLRKFGRRGDVARIVLHLDPVLEPEQVCWAIRHVRVDGAPVTDAVELRGVVTVLDAGTWLADAGSADDVTDRALADLPDDERTIAQLVVGQAEFADLLVLAGGAEPWQAVRTEAVLARLAPLAPRVPADRLDHRVLLADLPAGARRGVPDDVHGALLRGQPPLDRDAGVQLVTFTARRPFHPERLHAAIDVLLDGVIRTRGRIWLATRPDAVLWLESAGGGLQAGHAGDWLAADPDGWEGADPERRAAAALRWDDRFGDRAQDLAILAHDADPADIEAGLEAALLTDAELAAGAEEWPHYPDPFGWWHADPCAEATPEPAAGRHRRDEA